MPKKTPPLSSITGIIGCQWGDEGKGKLIDILATCFDIIVRAGGGANAGHTVYFQQGNHTLKMIFHLIPSGIIHPHAICVIGNGCVVHLPTLFSEISELKKLGVNLKNRLYISERAHLLFEYHKKIDALREQGRGLKKIGTTLRGIGPCYSDKINRIGIQIHELRNFSHFKNRYISNMELHTKMYGQLEFSSQDELKAHQKYATFLKNIVIDTNTLLQTQLNQGKKILLEGANGTMLDLDHGTYPYVTSSHPTVGGLLYGSGVPAQKLGTIIGILKAYTTRVGGGPFPTELKDSLGAQIREQGGEYGATTGRPRRCGWFDAVVAKYALAINGVNMINLTKLDVLSGINTIKIAIQYHYARKAIPMIPLIPFDEKKLRVSYLELPGWKEDLSSIKKFADLPKNCQKYIETIEKILNTRIVYIGVGQKRAQLIIRKAKYR